MSIASLSVRPLAAAAALLGLLVPAVAFPQPANAEDVPGSRPASSIQSLTAQADGPGGLHVVVNERGRLSRSIVGMVSDGGAETVTVTKPPGATVRGAYLATATTGFTRARLTSSVRLDGQPVVATGEIPNGIHSYNYFTDVTSLLKAKLDEAPVGSVAISYTEPSSPSLVDGSILNVIWDDPAVSADLSVTILYGALRPEGDTYDVTLTEPVDRDDPATRLEMSVGISYSYQRNGTQQYSTVDVNRRRVSTAAGGEDDGRPYNGALLTVGGDGDGATNPADPMARPTNAQSDDELYDLEPFVSDGDARISVATTNPSFDDNVFVSTFTMNPPVQSIATGDPGFVYVALGDSYQSGEGAATHLRPSAAYLAQGYENGSNYPDAAGAQENTYTRNALGSGIDGNACHRALRNYAKLNRDRFEPGQGVLLIDRTCSGAQIEPAGKPPVVGTVGGGIDPSSQLQQALDLLEAQGLTADDVDLVTVGMGGNDARFGDILTACVGPALLEAALRKYPNAPGEITWVAQQATCARVDSWFVKTQPAIDALAAKEIWARGVVASTFENARFLQPTYPNILPVSDSPEWCGGLRGNDVDYATQKVADINGQIRTAAKSSPGELVDVENLFGPNALCPGGKDGAPLAVGIDKAKFDLEIARLLNLNGAGDAVARGKLDDLVDAYNAYKACAANKLNPFDGSDCDLGAHQDAVVDRAKAVQEYFAVQEEVIFGNVMSPAGTSDDTTAVAFDRSRGLFHPNAAGFEVLACAVLAKYQGKADLSECNAVGVTGDEGGVRDVTIGDVLRIVIKHFWGNTHVYIRVYSQEVDLGTVMADADGTVDTSVVVPTLPPGVHRLELQGQGANGTQVTRQVLIRVPGRPSGSYTTYLEGFEKRPTTLTAGAPIETVRVTVAGHDIGLFQVDRDGGVLVSVPSVNQLRSNVPMSIVATSALTGKSVTEVIHPIPTAPSLWATGTGAEAVRVVGARFAANGLVHSEGGLKIAGAGDVLSGGLEYATTFVSVGGHHVVVPAPAQTTPAQGGPLMAALADFRPGAVASGWPDYAAVPAAACVDGVWRPSGPSAVAGIVYVPCAVELRTGGHYDATIAAEGGISVAGDNITVGRSGAAGDGQPSLLSAMEGAAVTLAGADVRLLGQVLAPNGKVSASGARAELVCGVVAAEIVVSGSDSSAPMAGRCLG